MRNPQLPSIIATAKLEALKVQGDSMHYEDVLHNIKQDENNETKTDLYRYNGLLEAIRYYANRLTFDQITDAAFDFINELLTVDISVMYLFCEGCYYPAKNRGTDVQLPVAQTEALEGFARFVGNVVTGRKNIEVFIPSDVLEAINTNVMVPLILEDKLIGFFLLSGRITAEFNNSDIAVCETLMSLFTSALDSCNRLERIQQSNKELDEKIFNLFAINQSAKAMLTEHNLSVLNRLAVDVFSELTQSACTSFVAYDNASEKYILKAYRNVFDAKDSPQLSFTLRTDAAAAPSLQIADLSNPMNRDYFNSLFEEGSEVLSVVKASYVAFIYGNGGRVLGFVTLGETVSGAPYKKGAFELVDSLASYTWIALSNAMHIKLVNDQKQLLQSKLERLILINALTKNINSSESSEHMLNLAIETLQISFGVEGGMIASCDEDTQLLTVRASTHSNLVGKTLPVNEKLEPLREGKILFECDASKVHTYLGEDIPDSFEHKSGLLALPIYLDRLETRLIGALFIVKTEDSQLSSEENVLTFETVTNHIAPIWENFNTLEKNMRSLKRDHAQVFQMDLEKQISECKSFDFNLEVIRIVEKSSSPFKGNKVVSYLRPLVSNIYEIAYDQTFIIVDRDFDQAFLMIEDELGQMPVTLSRYRMNKDFNTLDEFLNLI